MSYSVINPLAVSSFCGLIKALLNAVMLIGLPVAVLFIVYAGFMFVWARGSDKGLTKAKQNFYYTVIGVGIFLGAWLIATVIQNTMIALGVTGIGACN